MNNNVHDKIIGIVRNSINLSFSFTIYLLEGSEPQTKKCIDCAGAYCEVEKGVFSIYIHRDWQSIVNRADFKTGTEYRINPFFLNL
ncbi:hypothetical protein [Paenibacillus glacialis]|uniref:Uncharacterized protein n=1 Tax=Paenibacillus glacialis TaxID=494026 RepID=A0A168NPF1_9BACL|nr:hypothetical protein [Paenibacillus glacialis]OAB45998.1 hypothetical protein PGLA_00955 [Paenibacillus glacialis]